MTYSYNAAVFRVETDNEFQFTLTGQNSTLVNTLRRNSTLLSLDEIEDIYSTKFSIFDYGDLVLVANSITFQGDWGKNGSIAAELPLIVNSTVWRYFRTKDEWSQLSWSSANSRYYLSSTPNQTVTFQILEGYAVEQPRKTAIQISLHFMLVVTSCNLLKLAVMLYVLVTGVSDPIVTLGDAISAFLENPEPLTEGKSMQSREEISSGTLNSLYKDKMYSQVVRQDDRNTWRPCRQMYRTCVGIERIGGAIIT